MDALTCPLYRTAERHLVSLALQPVPVKVNVACKPLLEPLGLQVEVEG